MNIKPLADRVLVLPAPAEEKVGGIIIPDTAKEKPLHGKVLQQATEQRMRKWSSKKVTRYFMANIPVRSLSMKA